MTVNELISICNPTRQTGPLPDRIGALQQDSRRIMPGDVFIAVSGMTVDGHDYVENALSQGASVIIGERPELQGSDSAAYLRVESTRSLLGRLAQAFEGDPASELITVGITGTNGKTTVATLVWQVLQRLGVKTGLLGTVCKQIGDRRIDSRLTTADPIELASDMRAMVDEGCTVLAMEVSSHALEQERTAGIDWNLAAFTNLSHDHLDYHEDMESYVAAKRKLFDSLGASASAVINADDPWAKEMTRNCKANLLDFAFDGEAALQCTLLHSGPDGIRIQAGDLEIRSPLAGRFNAYNVVEALLICKGIGYEESRITEALKVSHGAAGRLEKVNRPDEIGIKPAVFVDYAHTPDALANVASTLSHLKEQGQELILLFGCGGDRDKAKRPEMAKVAEMWADRIVVTSDNPRSEDPEEIIRQIETGFSGRSGHISITSREHAIRHAIRSAPPEALILIAGKGHENYQEIAGERFRFDDREVARDALDDYEYGHADHNLEVR